MSYSLEAYSESSQASKPELLDNGSEYGFYCKLLVKTHTMLFLKLAVIKIFAKISGKFPWRDSAAGLFPKLYSPCSRRILWKNDILKKTKNATLNGCISKARTNSESELTFAESSFNFVQNRVVFCTLYPRG